MPKLAERGVAHILFLLLLVVGLVAGVYLITQQTPFNFLPKASLSKPTGPEVSFTLVGPSGCTAGILCIIYGQHALEEEFEVKLYARSDIETANLFTAKMTFPANLVEVKEIKEEKILGDGTINWVEDFYDNNTGEIALVAGVPAPGYQTQVGGESALMATIIFKAKALGKGVVSFTDSSEILSNLNNINILTIKRGYDISVEVKPSPTPSPVSSFGKAVKLDGDPQFVQIPNSSYLNSYINFTVEAWIKPNLPSSNAFERSAEFSRIISKSSGSANAYDLSYISYNTTDGKVHYSYQFGVAAQQINCAVVTADSQNGTTGTNGATVSPEQASSWRHIAGVVLNGNLYIYENGQLVAKNEYNIQQTCNNANTLQFGARSGGTWQDSYFKGQIDEVRLSRVARYNANFTVPTQPFTNDAGIGGLWHLDSNVNDSSGGGGNGQVQGGAQFVDSTIGQPQPSETPSPCRQYDGNVKSCDNSELDCAYYYCSNQCWPTGTDNSVACPPKGDGNKDGEVNLIDMSVLHTDWKADINLQKVIREGIDMNNDGLVNTFDFSALRDMLAKLGVIRTR